MTEWKLVPVEPTEEMEDAADRMEDSIEKRGAYSWEIYRAMLAAAPSPPADESLADRLKARGFTPPPEGAPRASLMRTVRVVDDPRDAEIARLKAVVAAHIADLRATALVFDREPAFRATAAEVRKAARELEDALRGERG
jgi:hypothetical protein